MSFSASIKCTTYGNGYFTFTVDSYMTFVQEIVPKFTRSKDRFVWRGMSNSQWNLQSSMSRELAKMRLSGNSWKTKATDFTIAHLLGYLEEIRGLSQLTRTHGKLYAALKEQQNRGYFAFTNVLYNLKEYENEILELFSLGQHHRMLTPFLDWTTTPQKALYFAFEETDSRKNGVGDRVVFALNKTAIEEECPPHQIPNDDWVIFLNSMAYDNPRIVGQDGLFSYVPAFIPLDRWVADRFNFKSTKKPILIRFLIQNRCREECLQMLDMTGINPRSMYPDLEGAALRANSRLQRELLPCMAAKSSTRNMP